MGAVPKNKITSAERGKRRHGNRPSLKKDLAQAQVPLYKKGLVAQIFQTIGLESPVSAKVVKERQAEQKKKEAQEKEQKKTQKMSKKKAAKKAPSPEPKSTKASEVKPSKQREAQVKTNKPSKQRAQDRG